MWKGPLWALDLSVTAGGEECRGMDVLVREPGLPWGLGALAPPCFLLTPHPLTPGLGKRGKEEEAPPVSLKR